MKKISFSVFVFFSIILFCSLGTWQVYRLQWKLDLISEINNGLNSDPVLYSNSKVINYQKVKFDGIFDFEKQIYLYSLNSKGAPGYDIITPMKTNSSEILLINRGWIKKDLKGNKSLNNIKSKSFEGIVKKITKPKDYYALNVKHKALAACLNWELIYKKISRNEALEKYNAVSGVSDLYFNVRFYQFSHNVFN